MPQAAQFLVQGKDDCARRASRGVDIAPLLSASCGALTVQQVYRLSEHQHDDWLGGMAAVGSQTVVLLEALK